MFDRRFLPALFAMLAKCGLLLAVSRTSCRNYAVRADNTDSRPECRQIAKDGPTIKRIGNTDLARIDEPPTRAQPRRQAGVQGCTPLPEFCWF
jgi:hypothetical protein